MYALQSLLIDCNADSCAGEKLRSVADRSCHLPGLSWTKACQDERWPNISKVAKCAVQLGRKAIFRGCQIGDLDPAPRCVG